MKKIILYSLTFLIVLISIPFLTESLLRVLSLFPADSSVYVNKKYVEFGARPNIPFLESHTNSRGFNDIEHAQKKKGRELRVSIIGDSFVFGLVKRDDNFVSGLEKIAIRNKREIEFINLGTPGIGPQSYVGLTADAINMDTDAICVMFYMGNDIIQSHPDFNTKVWLGIPRPILKKPYTPGLSGEYYYTYRAFRMLQRKLSDKGRSDFDGKKGFSDYYLHVVYDHFDLVFNKNSGRLLADAYAGVYDLFQKMKNMADRDNKKLVVIIIPSEIEVNSRLARAVFKRFKLPAKDYDFQAPHQRLLGIFQTLKIPVLDLLFAFQKENKHVGLFIPNDSHWNEKGNRFAAIRVWNFLNETRIHPVNKHRTAMVGKPVRHPPHQALLNAGRTESIG